MSRTTDGRDFMSDVRKTCTRCGIEKDLSDFYVGKQGRAGIRRPMATCKKCNIERTAAYYAANREASLTTMRNCHYKAKYGLTAQEADELKAHGCAICGRMANLFIDHDHATGRVRGVCASHNTALGLLGDSLDGLMAAAAYLMASENFLSEVTP